MPNVNAVAIGSFEIGPVARCPRPARAARAAGGPKRLGLGGARFRARVRADNVVDAEF